MQPATSATSKFAPQRTFIIALLLTIPFVVVGLLLYLTLGDHPYTLTDNRAGATLTFNTDPRWVLFTNSCVQVTWKTDHIREIYLGSQATVGEGAQQVCLNQNAPAFLIRFRTTLRRIKSMPCL